MSSEQRSSGDRISYYTMKTSGLQQPVTPHAHARSHSRSNSQSFFSSRQTSTPVPSPRAPHSVGQPYAPKLSPGAHRAVTQDTRTPSPNYFGLSIEPTLDPRESSLLPLENWSPPTSAVKSFAAAIPKQLPLDANPEFEAFRRQVDVNRGKTGFSLSTSQFSVPNALSHTPSASTPSALQRPRPPRWHTHGSDTSDPSFPRASGLLCVNSRTVDTPGKKNPTEINNLQDSAHGSADPKRNSGLSLNPPSVLGIGRHESPAPIEPSFRGLDQGRSNFFISQVDDRHPRLSLVQARANPPSPHGLREQQPRAETVPLKLESGSPSMMSPSQLRDLMEGGQDANILLLDIRVSPQFSQSRVRGALNLCIPTTLLKRATFDLKKLQSAFQAEQDRERFAGWRSSSHLVVYDAFSSEKRDAVSAMNMIKKFANEGYSGSTNILRGGFNAFAAAYPELVDRTSGRAPPGLSLGAGPGPDPRSGVAPVIGGVLLPNMSSNVNPFFNNIRQNQDLVDGVGQMDISIPAGLDKSRLPRWLRDATEADDHGKRVADKFLRIELTEQSRMREAYSGPHHTESMDAQHVDAKVQLSGIEQGGKNRYKDILPFEHARVKLLGRPIGSCDYVNASHIHAKRSHKRYIASQGPLPATFEDFWSVIWDQDVRVIVMLTAESEGGQLKCHPYWKGKDFGPIRLRALSEKKVSLDIDGHRPDSTQAISPVLNPPTSIPSAPAGSSAQSPSSQVPSQAEVGRRRANTTTTLKPSAANTPPIGGRSSETPYAIIRKFALSHAAQPFSPIREVTQLHYPSWPDFGAPAQPSHLLALVELANVMQRAALPIGITGVSAGARQNERSARTTNSTGDHAIPLSWHDAPESKQQARPMLVHCSAGCGRTGAFCTVDSVIDMLKRQKLCAAHRANKKIDDRERQMAKQTNDQANAKTPVLHRDFDGDVTMSEDMGHPKVLDDPAVSTPLGSMTRPAREFDEFIEESDIDTSWLDDEGVDLIARTVEDFRSQRLSMVQSLRQFALCYETVIEWIWRLQERGGGVDVKKRGRSGSLAM